MWVRILPFCSLLTLSACQVLNPNFYKPGPSWFQHFVKPGVSDNDVMRAMLECGAPSPIGVNANDSREAIVLTERCMIEDGFSYVNGPPTCVWSKDEYRACLADAVIPKRDLQRRLSSQFCKTNSTWKICQPGS
jgi:hypothetical protein